METIGVSVSLSPNRGEPKSLFPALQHKVKVQGLGFRGLGFRV